MQRTAHGTAPVGVECEATVEARERLAHALGLVAHHDDERIKLSGQRNPAGAAHERLARNRQQQLVSPHAARCAGGQHNCRDTRRRAAPLHCMVSALKIMTHDSILRYAALALEVGLKGHVYEALDVSGLDRGVYPPAQ